jgi:hypothetical protein
MYTCSEIERLLDFYTDGELDDPDRLLVEAHFRECSSCSRLALRKREEARLLHSGMLVPALSDGFTERVMAELDRDRCRARDEGLVWPRRIFARPWLAPGLAGLLLLAAICWAASGGLLPGSHEKVALQTSDQAASDRPALSLPVTGAPGQDPGFSDERAIVDNKGTRPWNGKNAVFSPSRDQNTVGEAVYRTGEERSPDQSLLETSVEELERRGYAVFEPDYLPAGYSLSSCYLYWARPGSGIVSQAPSGSGSEPLPGWGSLLLTYRNTQDDGWLILVVRPTGSQAPVPGSAAPGLSRTGAALPLDAGPQTPAGETPGLITLSAPPGAGPEALSQETAGANTSPSARPSPAALEDYGAASRAAANPPPGSPAPAIEAEGQPSAANPVTWQTQKNGAGFLLTVSGNSLPREELQKVAASVQ